jgi:proteic killer suppression protein
MISNLGSKLTEDIFYDRKTRETRKFPNELYRVARRKLLYLYEAEVLRDLRIPLNNRLELLRGSFKGYYSIRINKQWRVIFKWSNNIAGEVKIIDYHK